MQNTTQALSTAADSFQQLAAEVFNAEKFREQGHKIVDLLADYLLSVREHKETEPVLPQHNAQWLLEQWQLNPGSMKDEDFIAALRSVINESIHLHHPRYIGHQSAPALPLAALCQNVNNVLNNAMGIFQMGPPHVVFEKRMIEWLCQKVGYDAEASGFFTSGGSLGNLTALLAARQIKAEQDVWENGLGKQQNLAILVSEQAHYSARRVLQIAGLGKKNIINVKTNEQYQVDSLANLEIAYQEAIKNHLHPIAVVGSACNTGPGTFDDLNILADFCAHKNLWLHVDAAHGGAVLVSSKYRHLLSGIERADSVIWDMHKMFLMPSLTTAVLFKRNEHSYQAFKQDAPYLLYKNGQEERAPDCWDENIKRNFECTRPSMAFGMFMALSCYGEAFFSGFVEYSFDLAKEFARHLEQDERFELLLMPQSNIICFRYVPETPCADLNKLQEDLLKFLNETGRFFIVKTAFGQKVYLRISLMNPLTSMEDLLELTRQLKSIAGEMELDAVEECV